MGKRRSLRPPTAPRLIVGGLLTALLVLAPCGSTVAQTPPIYLDGSFEDWVDRTHLTDTRWRGNPDPPTINYMEDIRTWYWATVEGQSFIYFMVERWPKPPQEVGMDDPVYYLVHFDMNTNGNYEEAIDRVAVLYYDPRPLAPDDNAWLSVYAGNDRNTVLYSAQGRWGEYGVGGSTQYWGLKVEFAVPFAALHYEVTNPQRSLSMYLAATHNIKSDPRFDYCPNEGDITWSPVPSLGAVLTLLLAAIGIVVAYRSFRRYLTPA